MTLSKMGNVRIIMRKFSFFRDLLFEYRLPVCILQRNQYIQHGAREASATGDKLRLAYHAQ